MKIESYEDLVREIDYGCAEILEFTHIELTEDDYRLVVYVEWHDDQITVHDAYTFEKLGTGKKNFFGLTIDFT